MNDKRLGRQTVALAHPPSVLSFANIGGKFEGQGPLADYFDEISPDSFFGEKTWEKAESAMQKSVLRRALERADLRPEDLDYILAGDLLNQCIGSSFGLRDFGVPFYGLYGACSTMGEGLGLAALLIDGGFARRCRRRHLLPLLHRRAAVPDAGALRQPADPHRPVDRHRRRLHHPGPRRPGALYHPRHLRKDRGQGHHRRQQHGRRHGPGGLRHPLRLLPGHRHAGRRTSTSSSPGTWGSWATPSSGTSSAGTAWSWAPGSRTAACCSMTGSTQDMHAGGSGCGCSASVLNGYVLRGMREGRWKTVLFAPTGALLSPASAFQGESIPGICHAVRLSAAR